MFCTTTIDACHQRLYDMAGPAWLISIWSNVPCLCYRDGGSQMPQARAVVDDFGNLVLVTGWH